MRAAKRLSNNDNNRLLQTIYINAFENVDNLDNILIKKPLSEIVSRWHRKVNWLITVYTVVWPWLKMIVLVYNRKL